MAEVEAPQDLMFEQMTERKWGGMWRVRAEEDLKKKKCNLFYTWSIIICGLCGRTEDEMGFDGAAFNGQCPDPTACSLTLTHMLTSTLPRAQFKKLINMPPPLIIRKLGEWPTFTYLRTCTEQKVGIVEAQSWFQISRKRDQDFE